MPIEECDRFTALDHAGLTGIIHANRHVANRPLRADSLFAHMSYAAYRHIQTVPKRAGKVQGAGLTYTGDLAT